MCWKTAHLHKRLLSKTGFVKVVISHPYYQRNVANSYRSKIISMNGVSSRHKSQIGLWIRNKQGQDQYRAKWYRFQSVKWCFPTAKSFRAILPRDPPEIWPDLPKERFLFRDTSNYRQIPCSRGKFRHVHYAIWINYVSENLWRKTL